MNNTIAAIEAQEAARLSAEAKQAQAAAYNLSCRFLPRGPQLLNSLAEIVPARGDISIIVGAFNIAGCIDHQNRRAYSFSAEDLKLSDGTHAAYFDQAFGRLEGYELIHVPRKKENTAAGKDNENLHHGMNRLVVLFIREHELASLMNACTDSAAVRIYRRPEDKPEWKLVPAPGQ